MLFLVVLVGSFLAARKVFAHEVYVLDKSQIASGLSHIQPLSLSVLQNPHNFFIFISITIAVTILFALALVFRLSRKGQSFYAWLQRLHKFAPLFVRAAIAASFFYSAYTWSFLGPELDLHLLPWAQVMRWTLFISSGMFLLGIGVEIAAAASLVVFLVGGYVFGWYVLTYTNYLGEIIALLLFGSRHFSLDRIVQGALKRFPRGRNYETVIVRVGYGIALLYAAITIKVLHPILTITVIKEYHLTQFHWLFPGDVMLVTFGAALAEIAIGLFILIGFETQLVVFISLIYITLSLLYFKEAVWPHLMLYGISLNLIFAKPAFSLNALIDAWARRHQGVVAQKSNPVV